jgi:hypothetical protein
MALQTNGRGASNTLVMTMMGSLEELMSMDAAIPATRHSKWKSSRQRHILFPSFKRSSLLHNL